MIHLTLIVSFKIESAVQLNPILFTFMEGLKESTHPFNTISELAVLDLLQSQVFFF